MSKTMPAGESITVRCYARKIDGQWVGVCLNFSLVAQGDSFEDVRRKLHEQVLSYVTDATIGADREHRDYLLSRRAPLRDFAIYYGISAYLWLATLIHRSRERVARWTEVSSLQPC